MDLIEEFLPAFQPIFLMVAGNPARDDGGEQALELGPMLGRMAKDVQGFRLLLEQVRQVRADHRVGFEFVERRIDFQLRRGQPGGLQAFEGGAGGVLLAAQAAAEDAVETDAEVQQVVAEDFRLADAGRRQHVVVVGTERRLAMSNQVDAAHGRTSAGESSARV